MPVSGVFTSCATPAASRPIDAIFSEICSCSSSCTRAVTSSMMTIVPTVVTAECVRRAQRHDRRVDDQRPATVAARADKRHARQRRPAGRVAARRPDRLDERRVEHVVERPAGRFGAARCRTTARAPSSSARCDRQVDDQQTVVERFEDVLVERAQAIELDGLHVELAVQPGVLERGGNLAGDRAEQRHVLAVQVAAGVLAAERQHRDRPFLRHARHEVVETGVAPELDLLDRKPADGDRIVERHDMTGGQARADARMLRQRRRVRVAEARGAHRAEVRRDVVLSSISAMRSTSSVSTTRETSRSASRFRSRSLLRSRAKPTSARR